MTEFRLADIQPNPFRDIENYPISEQKVAELMASYETTRVWRNVNARLVGRKPQIAYGHHRIEAARRLYGEGFKYPLIIEDLSDDEMFRMMASENMDVYQASAQVTQNTIESLVKAYAEGKLHPLQPQRIQAGGWRYAPSFDSRRGTPRGENPYTAETLRDYLGWTSLDKVKNALQALEIIEQGGLKRSDFEGLSMDRAESVMRSIGAAKKASISPTRKQTNGALVKKVREAVVAAAKAGKGHERIRDVADRIIEQHAPLIEKPVVPRALAESIYNDIDRFFANGKELPTGTVSRQQLIRLIAENRDAAELQGLATRWADQIAHALDRLADQAAALAGELRQEAPRLEALHANN